MSTNTNETQGSQESIFDLEDNFRKDQRHPEHDPGLVIRYKIKIDDQYHLVDHRHQRGSALLELANKSAEQFELFQIQRENGVVSTHLIPAHESVDLGTYGIERFITKVREFCFSVDKAKYTTPHEKLTVRQILVDFAKVSPENKTLAVKTDGGFHEYKNLDEEIDLRHCPHFTLFDNTPTGVSCL
jgi:hypothetical protein